jgi:urease accessory protein UreH
MQGIIDIHVSNAIPRINKIYQSSLSRVFFPTEQDSKVLNCIFVNQAGGIHGDDQFSNTITLSNHAHIKFTSQAAEKIYYSRKNYSLIHNNFTIKENSHFSYLPQELIFFNQSKLKKNNSIYVEEDSSLLFAEQFVLGREFFNEQIKKIFFEDITKIFVNKKILYTDQSIIHDIEVFHQYNILSKPIQSFANIIFYKKNIKDMNLNMKKFFLDKDFYGYSYPSNSLLVCKFIDNNTLKLKLKLFDLINFLGNKVIKKKDYLHKNMYF